MSKLIDRLRETPLLLADGAWGTEFLQCGLDLALEPADAWNLSQAEVVVQLATAYAEDADLITTNTFGANRLRLATYRLGRKAGRINALGVSLARKGIRERRRGHQPVLVAGSMGPARNPGDASVDDIQLFDVYREQAAHLARAGADLLVVETMTSAVDARIAVRAARAACPLEIVCSYAFHEVAPGQFQTWSGEPVERAIGTALDAGAVAAGANCVPATEAIVPLIRSMRDAADSAPLWLKPNAGQPREARESFPHPLSLAPLDEILDALGTGVIGGCCGTTPGDIGHLRRVLSTR